MLTAVIACGASASAASAAFPSSPTLDTFTSDQSLSPGWTTPALGDNPMYLDPTAHELTGIGTAADAWAGALWNNPPSHAAFSNPIEVWATLARVGPGVAPPYAPSGVALLYADVTGGASGSSHPSSGYFAEFGSLSSTVSTGQVSIWQITGPDGARKLASVNAPYSELAVGDRIGLSINHGVIIAWFMPVGSTWRAMVSTVDAAYTSGDIALEDLPGPALGFGAFGGGAPSAPVTSQQTTTTIIPSATSVGIGQQVTYSASVTPAPSLKGTVAFLDGDVAIPQCEERAVKRYGEATCTLSYASRGSHTVSALYSGSPDGAFAGSTNRADARLLVVRFRLGRPRLRVVKHSFDLVVGCPKHSGSCAVNSSVTIALSPVTKPISLGKLSAKFKAGRDWQFVFVLNSETQAALRRYLRGRSNALVGVAANLTVRQSSGGSDRVTFNYIVAGSSVVAQL